MSHSFQERMEVLRQAFAASLDHDVAEALRLLRAGDRHEAAALIHRIAGRAGTFGAPQVSEAAGRIEQLLPRGSVDELEAAFTVLVHASGAAVERQP
jgi:HPt (histidine-containing phosphotransfer) domain-containing protein